MHIGIVMILIIVFVKQINYNFAENTSERAVARISGDFVIGLFVSVHHQPKSKITNPNDFLKCGEIREHYGIQRTEIALKTIDEINANNTLLPNITLGIEIRDSCWYAPIALQQTIEMIKHTISPKTQNSDTCMMKNETEDKSITGQLIGVVGPGSSSVAMQVQNLLQLFSIPQIGYSTTSKDLTDKARFSTFMRVVPSDSHQAKVIVDIVKYFNWTYVSVVNTAENYGQSGIQEFRDLAEKGGICIAKVNSILSNDNEEKFIKVLDNLAEDKNARVVVCFCEGMTIRNLLKAMKKRSEFDFLLIGTDGWADRADVVENYEEQAVGSISIRIHSPPVKWFDEYYDSLKPHNNSRNPWFREFWEYKFNCTMPHRFYLEEERNSHMKRMCTGREKLSDNYHQEPKLSFLIKAIYTIAYALQTLQQNKCGTNYTGKCEAMKTFNGKQFFEHLKNVSFIYPPIDGDVVEFDRNGDPPGRYDIITFQKGDNGSYGYVQFGQWKNGTLIILNKPEKAKNFTSVCSKPCGPGSYKQHQSGGQEQKCCWSCRPCEAHQFLYNETHCENCPLGEAPNINKTICMRLPRTYVKWTDSEALISISFALVGFVITFFVLIVFVQYNNTPVVKASTRELCYLILVGMMLSHISIIFFIVKPNEYICTINRILPGISFSMIYASLLIKTNRIARILAGSKKRFPTRKPKFMSASAQLLLTSILIFIEGAISIGMVISIPADSKEDYASSKEVVFVVCNTISSPIAVIAPLGFNFLLIAMCTLYALKTRNVPENFNEAKFVGFSMYTTCVIWIAFVPIYFGSESKIITMCLCISLSAMVTLAFIFFPKLYIILIRPEKNIRALFTTSKTIRCHIGSRVASALSQKTSSSFSNGPASSPDEYDRNIRIKPIIRSSSCQTSVELLNVLFDIQNKYSGLNEVPSLGWSELNVKDLQKKSNDLDKQKIFSNGEHALSNPAISLNNTNNNNRIQNNSSPNLKCVLDDNKIPDSCSLLNGPTGATTSISKSSRLKHHGNNNRKSSINNINSKTEKLSSIMSMKNEQSKKKSSSNNSSNSKNRISKSNSKINICVQCAEIENNNSKLKVLYSSEQNLNEQNAPIFSIDSPYLLKPINCNNKLLKATISEESLSECSLSESCDCKLKSITIRLASPTSK